MQKYNATNYTTGCSAMRCREQSSEKYSKYFFCHLTCARQLYLHVLSHVCFTPIRRDKYHLNVINIDDDEDGDDKDSDDEDGDDKDSVYEDGDDEDGDDEDGN